jgi:hypothetical protein
MRMAAPPDMPAKIDDTALIEQSLHRPDLFAVLTLTSRSLAIEVTGCSGLGRFKKRVSRPKEALFTQVGGP